MSKDSYIMPPYPLTVTDPSPIKVKECIDCKELGYPCTSCTTNTPTFVYGDYITFPATTGVTFNKTVWDDLKYWYDSPPAQQASCIYCSDKKTCKECAYVYNV